MCTSVSQCPGTDSRTERKDNKIFLLYFQVYVKNDPLGTIRVNQNSTVFVSV